MYSHFSGLNIGKDAKGIVERSVKRYKEAIGS
jgi:hypothetical protein